MKLNFMLISLLAPCLLFAVTFEPARVDQAKQLTALAMESNAHWNYRNASSNVVKSVLGITAEQIKCDTVRVMMEGGEIVGFFALKRRPNIMCLTMNELSFFFLKPKYIGKGYGKLLFQEMKRVAKDELGWSALIWDSDPFAAGFYRKMGAKEIGFAPCPLNLRYQAPLFVLVLD